MYIIHNQVVIHSEMEEILRMFLLPEHLVYDFTNYRLLKQEEGQVMTVYIFIQQ